jgi:hypothetical protein
MGWGRSAVFSHAKRLEREGWVKRYPTVRGRGSLLVATSSGVRMIGAAVSPASPPVPTWWAHLHACGWVAAWLTVRGRVMQGCREVDEDPSWGGDVRWHDGKGAHRSRHRPDLAVIMDGVRFGVEVELARKSVERLKAIVGLHARWRAAGQAGGVIYVCADQAGAERVREIAAERGPTHRPRRWPARGASRADRAGDTRRRGVSRGRAYAPGSRARSLSTRSGSRPDAHARARGRSTALSAHRYSTNRAA